MSEPQYKRVLLKISGEALAGDARRGLDFDVIGKVCDVVKQCVEKGIEVAIVVGGGNFWRGMKDGGDRMQRRQVARVAGGVEAPADRGQNGIGAAEAGRGGDRDDRLVRDQGGGFVGG